LAAIEAEKAELAKGKVEAKEREEALSVEVEMCHTFMLRRSEDYFHQELRQSALYHGIPLKDPQYDLDQDVVDGKLVPIGGNADNPMEDKGGENVVPQAEPELSFEEILEPL